MKRSISMMFMFVLAACGDNLGRPDRGSGVDAGPPDAHVPLPRAVAAAGDFGSPGTGVLSRLDIETLSMSQNIVASVAQGDPVLRQHGDKLYVINRYGSNNITILNAKTLAFEEQISTGEASNPQDVAVVGDKLYVPAMGTKGVVVIEPGASAHKTIDLSALDTVGGDDDGVPECMSAYAIDTRVFVVCGVLDGFAAVEPAKVAIIDTATDTMVGSLSLTHGNPVGHLERTPADSVFGGDLLLATVPDYIDYTSGCIERISTGTSPAATCALTNQELGGYVNATSVAHDGSTLYIAVATYEAGFTNPTGTLEGLDLESGMLWTAPLSSSSQLIVDVAACPNGDVVATDQTFNKGGLRVWSGTTERTTDAKPIGMPPATNALVCYDAR
jgi:hypothetical protein